jgi:hypothetical protein
VPIIPNVSQKKITQQGNQALHYQITHGKMLLQIFSIENMKLINLRLSFEEHAVKDSIPKVNTVLVVWF